MPAYSPAPQKAVARPQIVALTAIGLLASTPACAYIDPGTGMMLLQGLVAGLGAVWFVVGKPFRWLSQKFKSLRRRDEGS